jgi:ribonucleoside-diphosphate reductase alpha chain
MGEIFDSVKSAAIIHQSGGGTGFAFSRLRPKNDTVRSTGGRASGPVSFLRVFNAATEAVKQGGTRRGANMGVLRVDHPDILEFIECKLDGGITNFNISVAITDAFMAALEAGLDYDLVNPRTGLSVGRLSAREVFDRIVHAAWRTGDLGRPHRPDQREPREPHAGSRRSKQPTHAASSPSAQRGVQSRLVQCTWFAHLRTGAGRSIGKRWSGSCAWRCFLDDVIEVNPYPLPEIDRTVKANRRIGLGIMGWADLLFALEMPYDSEEALDLAERLMAFVAEKGRDQSARLAEERGPFPNFSRSIYRDGRPLRNSTVTTIAPTGTISMIAGCSSGIEPVFALAFEHRVKGIDGERVLPFVCQSFERLGRERGFHSDTLMSEVARRGTLHGIPGVPEEARAVFKTAHEIHWSWHVRHQLPSRSTRTTACRRRQPPAEAAETDVAEAYLLHGGRPARHHGLPRRLQGRTGAQYGVTAEGDHGALVEQVVKPRPHSLSGGDPDGDSIGPPSSR